MARNRNYTDVTFSYKETNFLAEIKFGNTSDSGVNHKIFSQAYRYAKEKNIENFLILVYPNDLSGHVYLGSEWFTDQCINNKIRCYIFTSKWSDEILDSPKNIFISDGNSFKTNIWNVNFIYYSFCSKF